MVHHTGDDAQARPTLEDVNAYQIGPSAQLPFPGLAYTGYIGPDGTLSIAWDVETVTWSQGDGSPYAIAGVGIYNYTGLAIVFSGKDPTPQQINTYKNVKRALEMILGRSIVVKGHRDVSGQHDTVCPGDQAEAQLYEIQSA